MKMKNDGIERRDMLLQDLELRVDGDTGAPTVEGYAAVWDSLSETLFEWNEGRFREKVAKGAFAKTIREQNVPLLVEHADLPLATTRAGTLQLTEDERGLRFSSMLEPSDPDVMRLIPKMRRGDMNKCSFGFVPVRETWDEKAKPRVRTLHEVKLFDVSIVARPAYSATEAKVRKALADDGLDAERIAEVLVRLRQGLELENDDLVLMRRLVESCQPYLTKDTEQKATGAEVAPGENAHPTDASQPAIERQCAPEQQFHPQSYYRDWLRRVEEQPE